MGSSKSRTALVTGASAGIGAELARLFAADKHDVILVARRRDRLDTLAADLARAHGVKAHVIAADLGTAGGADLVVAEVARLGLEVDFLVNNAGFGAVGGFADLDAARELEMVQVNVTTLVALTRALLPAMIARGSGRVLNIGSTAGFVAGPFMAIYYASKAFVNSFTEALSFELKGTGVTATVSCPGATVTEFGAVAGNDASRLFRMGAASAGEVAREAYRAMHAGQPMIIHGLKNRFAMWTTRFAPRVMLRALAAQLNHVPGAQKNLPR